MARWATDHMYMMHMHARHAIVSRKTLLLWRAAYAWRWLLRPSCSDAIAAFCGPPRQ